MMRQMMNYPMLKTHDCTIPALDYDDLFSSTHLLIVNVASIPVIQQTRRLRNDDCVNAAA